MNKLLPVVVALCALTASSAQAQLFGGDEQARRQINELREQLTTRIDSTSRGQLELVNQNEALRAEVAQLRGEIEVLTHELESLKQRQRDFYVDLDARLQRLEPGAGSTGSTSAGLPADLSPTPSADTAAETQAYESALNLLKENRHAEAQVAFGKFISTYPNSASVPNAHFWAGNAALQARDIATARRHFNTILDTWPQGRVAPDAMLGLANTQQALGDARGSQETLRKVIATYPNSSAAQVARQRLGQ